MRKYLVPLAALALMLVLLAPGGASARASCSPSSLGEAFSATTSEPQSGQIVRFTYKALPSCVDTLTATLRFAPNTQLLLLKKGSMPYQLVEGKPTWTRRSLNQTTLIHFNVLVKRTAPKGRRQLLWLDTSAVTGDWTQKASLLGILHVKK